MSVLSDISIRTYIEAGRIKVEPMTEGAIQPSSVDLKLGPALWIAKSDGWHTWDLIDDGPLRVYQGQFVLGATLEWIELPDDLVGVLVGKSSRAREGLQVEAAGYVDPGWRGNLTIELTTRSPIPFLLTAGMPIAQIRFERMTTPAERPYGSDGLGSHYQRSHGPVLSAVSP